MTFHEGDVIKIEGSGEVGRICRVEAGGCWVFLEESGCIFVPIDILVPVSGNPPPCPSDCPPI